MIYSRTQSEKMGEVGTDSSGLVWQSVLSSVTVQCVHFLIPRSWREWSGIGPRDPRGTNRKKKFPWSWTWLLILVIPAFGKLRQKDPGIPEVSLMSIVDCKILSDNKTRKQNLMTVLWFESEASRIGLGVWTLDLQLVVIHCVCVCGGELWNQEMEPCWRKW